MGKWVLFWKITAALLFFLFGIVVLLLRRIAYSQVEFNADVRMNVRRLEDVCKGASAW